MNIPSCLYSYSFFLTLFLHLYHYRYRYVVERSLSEGKAILSYFKKSIVRALDVLYPDIPWKSSPSLDILLGEVRGEDEEGERVGEGEGSRGKGYNINKMIREHKKLANEIGKKLGITKVYISMDKILPYCLYSISISYISFFFLL